MASDPSAIGRSALLAVLMIGAVAGPARAQETSEQREACMQDTKRLCENAMPDVGRAVECLKAHRSNLNRRCRVALDKPPSPVVAPSPQAAPDKPAAPADAPKPQGSTPAQPEPAAATDKTSRKPPHLAFAPHWRYTLRKPQVPIARVARHRTMTPAERVVAMQRSMARRCRAAGTTYNAYSGTCGYNYFGGFFQ